MNLNEVKKHTFFQISLYILIGICLLLSLFVILITPAKAQEVSVNFTNSIYPGYVNNYGCNSGTTGQYCAINTNGYVNPRNFNTRYNGVLGSIEFESSFYFRNNTTYTFDIYANSNDFRNNNVTAYCYSYDNYPSQAVSVACSYRFISKTHIQVVYPYNTYSHHFIQIVGTQVTGDTNYSLKSVYVSYDDGTQDFSGVIDNATNNTTDIINNNNSNAQDTQNVIYKTNELIMNAIANKCPNLLDPSKYIIDPEAKLGFIVNLTPGYTYTLTSNVPIYAAKFSVYSFNPGDVSGPERWDPNGFTSWTFTAQDSSYNLYLAFSVYNFMTDELPDNIHLMLTSSSINTSYCPYGSSLSKLDEIGGILGGLSDKQQDTNDKLDDLNDTSQQTYDYLTDDTDPEVDSDGIEDVLGEVEISDPLNYLLTLPLSLLQKLNQVLSANSCQRVSFGTLYDTELYLPCIDFVSILGSNIWNTVDLIVGVGLLAIILKRFYDSISNVLTLGKEKEVRDKLDLPTPMQFLASILGGGSD